MFTAAFFVTGTSWKPQMGRVRKVKQAAVPLRCGALSGDEKGVTHTPGWGGSRGHSFEHVTIGGSWGTRTESLSVLFATSYINLKSFQNKNVKEKYRLMSVVFHMANLPSGRDSSKDQRTSWQAWARRTSRLRGPVPSSRLWSLRLTAPSLCCQALPSRSTNTSSSLRESSEDADCSHTLENIPTSKQ